MPSQNIGTGLYIDKGLLDTIPVYLQKVNCRSRNEFIIQSIMHYIAFLQKEDNSALLTPALESVLSGKFGDSENRIARVIFKLAVEVCMMLHVAASQFDITEEQLDGLRKMCVEEVSKLSGRISFEGAYRHQKN